MHGRLRRTARFIAVTTYGQRDDALAAIARVNRIHTAVAGTLPDGTAYSARDPRTLAWVHVAEATSFLTAYVALVRESAGEGRSAITAYPGSPLLVVHGAQDRLIPSDLGRRLYDAATGSKRFVLVEGGSHHSTMAVGQDRYREALAELFSLR